MVFQSSKVQSAALPNFYCLIYTSGYNIRSSLVEICGTEKECQGDSKRRPGERGSHFICTGNQHFILRFEYLDSLINSLVRGVKKLTNMINSFCLVHAPPQLQTNNKKVFCIHTHKKLTCVCQSLAYSNVFCVCKRQ